jgi:hypothetical protein
MTDPKTRASSSAQPKHTSGSMVSRFKGSLGFGRKNQKDSRSAPLHNFREDHRRGDVEHSKTGDGKESSLSGKVSTSTDQKPSSSTQSLPLEERLCPISELWNQAYDDLKRDEEKLVSDYQSVLSSDLAMTMITPTLMIMGSKEERQQQMAALLARKVEEAKKKTWKLKFGGKEIPVKEVVESVVGIISWADDYISGALSTNPYASVAWGGVSLLLPVSPNT